MSSFPWKRPTLFQLKPGSADEPRPTSGLSVYVIVTVTLLGTCGEQGHRGKGRYFCFLSLYILQNLPEWDAHWPWITCASDAASPAKVKCVVTHLRRRVHRRPILHRRYRRRHHQSCHDASFQAADAKMTLALQCSPMGRRYCQCNRYPIP